MRLEEIMATSNTAFALVEALTTERDTLKAQVHQLHSENNALSTSLFAFRRAYVLAYQSNFTNLDAIGLALLDANAALDKKGT